MALAARDECNSFSYWDARYERFAVGVVPGASLVNHSCTPNAAKAHGSHFAVEIYALQEIAEGEDVTICYTPLTSGLAERRAILHKHFGFFCEVRRDGLLLLIGLGLRERVSLCTFAANGEHGLGVQEC